MMLFHIPSLTSWSDTVYILILLKLICCFRFNLNGPESFKHWFFCWIKILSGSCLYRISLSFILEKLFSLHKIRCVCLHFFWLKFKFVNSLQILLIEFVNFILKSGDGLDEIWFFLCVVFENGFFLAVKLFLEIF